MRRRQWQDPADSTMKTLGIGCGAILSMAMLIAGIRAVVTQSISLPRGRYSRGSYDLASADAVGFGCLLVVLGLSILAAMYFHNRRGK